MTIDKTLDIGRKGGKGVVSDLYLIEILYTGTNPEGIKSKPITNESGFQNPFLEMTNNSEVQVAVVVSAFTKFTVSQSTANEFDIGVALGSSGTPVWLIESSSPVSQAVLNLQGGSPVFNSKNETDGRIVLKQDCEGGTGRFFQDAGGRIQIFVRIITGEIVAKNTTFEAGGWSGTITKMT